MLRKPCVILVWFFCFTAISAKAQLSVGPKVGVQAFQSFFSSSESKDLYKSKPHPGFTGGLAALVEVSDNFSLRFELAYAQKGKKIEGRSDSQLKNVARYNHIELPILFTRRFIAKSSKGGYEWFLAIGPNTSYWLGGKGELESSELTFEYAVQTLNYDIDFNLDRPFGLSGDNVTNIKEPNRIQLGLNFGGGFIFKPNKTNTIVVDLRFEWGNTFIGKKDAVVEFPYVFFDYMDDIRATNSGVKLSIAYLFDLKLDQLKRGRSTNDNSKKRR
ncbi:porin family protein [Fulvivirgaceae bacterium BMA10]|uniref:Porin family protein n=1 Tax=Splendidivirga corallicola TaxID=3051826 RepID=A0ABT8KR53_9BACT|nr:porin family protein [Fulvivirgaceae bacterium BMA10]